MDTEHRPMARTRRRRGPGALLARAGGRAHPVRRLPALLQAARGPARPVFRARAAGRRDGADHLRAVLRVLHRSDREEAAQSFPAGHAGVLVRHRRLQPDLQVLPELGHLQGARDRQAEPERLAAAIAAAARQLGCRSVAFTYNDPVIFLEYAVDTARACHEAGLKTVAVTAGYITHEARGEFYEHIDAANVDLKGFTEAFYRNLCGGRLADVLDTLVWLRRETKVWLEITTLLIPGENDCDAELGALAAGSPRSWAPTCRCISPRSIPTGRCASIRRRRRRR